MSLVATLQLAHCDVHSGNVIVSASGEPLLIDPLDFHRNAADVYITAYLPENYKALTPFERDRYSIAAVLSTCCNRSATRPRRGCCRIRACIRNQPACFPLKRSRPSCRRSARCSPRQCPREDLQQSFTVKNLASDGISAGELRSDNGVFHVDSGRPGNHRRHCASG